MADYIPAKEIKALILKRVTEGDRAPFHNLLADGLRHAPRMKDWRELRKDPEAYARTIDKLAKLAGYTERTEHVRVNVTGENLASRLVAIHGPDQARAILKAHGLPESLVEPDSAGTTIDATPLPTHQEEPKSQ